MPCHHLPLSFTAVHHPYVYSSFRCVFSDHLILVQPSHQLNLEQMATTSNRNIAIGAGIAAAAGAAAFFGVRALRQKRAARAAAATATPAVEVKSRGVVTKEQTARNARIVALASAFPPHEHSQTQVSIHRPYPTIIRIANNANRVPRATQFSSVPWTLCYPTCSLLIRCCAVWLLNNST
jgi:hypothetical protein